MKKDADILKIVEKQKLNGLSQTTLPAGGYIAEKINTESTMLTRAKGTKEKFTQTDSPGNGDDLLIFAEVGIVYPRARKSRVSVPVDYLSWNKGQYMAFTVNAQGFANFRDEPLTKEQAEAIMADIAE